MRRARVLQPRANAHSNTASGTIRPARAPGCGAAICGRRALCCGMHRRTFLSTGSLAALGLAAQGCAPWSRDGFTRWSSRLQLPVVRASWDRIIRTTVGLRPHRDAGFVLKADKLDDKLLVHNYGHGGAGMSLAVGHRADGGGVRDRAPGAAGGRHRLRLGRAHVRAAAPAPRLRRDDLRDVGAALRDVEHVARRLHAELGPRRQRSADAGVGRAVPARRRHFVSPAAAARRPALRRQLARTTIRSINELPSRPPVTVRSVRASTSRAARRAGSAGAGRASVRDQVRDASRRRSGSSRRSIWTTWCATSSCGAARSSSASSTRRASCVAARADRDQLHGPRREGSVRRSGAGAAEGSADGAWRRSPR